MSLTQLQQDIENNSLKKVYYLFGDEPFLIHFYINKIIQTLFGGNNSGMDYYKFEGDMLDVSTFCDTMALYPVFAQKKLIQINDLPITKNPLGLYLIKHIDLLQDDTVLLFVERTVKLNKSIEAVKAFIKMVRENGLYVEIKRLDVKTLFKWTAKQCKILNIDMSKQDAEYFIDIVGNDMYTVQNELKKLAAFCKGRTVSKVDIDKICIKCIDSQGYLITDAILNKNLENAYLLLNDYAEMKTSAELIAGTIFNFVTRLYKIKYLLSLGENITQIALKIGIKEYPVKKYSAVIKNLSIQKIEKMIDICTRSDIAIKATGIDNYIILHKLVTELVGQL